MAIDTTGLMKTLLAAKKKQHRQHLINLYTALFAGNATVASAQDLTDEMLQAAIDANKTSQVPLAAEKPVPFSLPIPAKKLDPFVNLEQALPELVWNEAQKTCMEYAVQGLSFCVVGAAGTGKTTAQKGTIRKLLESNQIAPMNVATKFIPQGSPGIAIVAFTRRARNNIRLHMPKELESNCLTIHQLLEFEPVREIRTDLEGNMKEVQVFKPQRNRNNPLPPSLQVIIVEESSMVGLDLFSLLMDALRHKVQFIFLGDIQQLQPIYDHPILGHKLFVENLPRVELTEVYRQADSSPILKLAHHILAGKATSPKIIKEHWNQPNLNIQFWQKALPDFKALQLLQESCRRWLVSGEYDPLKDVILLPFNKAVGTLEVNKALMQYIGESTNAVVYEIIAGFNKHYLAVGDKMMFDKEDCVITKIAPNHRYIGAAPLIPSTNLTRWGQYKNAISEQDINAAESHEISVDDYLAAAMSTVEDHSSQASHTVTIKYLNSAIGDDNLTEDIYTTGGINKLLGGYALTVHKAQGCEWRKVFFLLHRSHAVMLKRELLYTAITRARESLHIICEQDTFITGVIKQAIKGNTLEEKSLAFKGKTKQTKLVE